jgi:hypothetical protein
MKGGCLSIIGDNYFLPHKLWGIGKDFVDTQNWLVTIQRMRLIAT